MVLSCRLWAEHQLDSTQTGGCISEGWSRTKLIILKSSRLSAIWSNSAFRERTVVWRQTAFTISGMSFMCARLTGVANPQSIWHHYFLLLEVSLPVCRLWFLAAIWLRKTYDFVIYIYMNPNVPHVKAGVHQVKEYRRFQSTCCWAHNIGSYTPMVRNIIGQGLRGQLILILCTLRAKSPCVG